MSSVSETAHTAIGSVTDTARQAPTMVREHTEGNPLAVGLIAFAVGWLAGSLVPSSQAEQQAAEQVKERARRWSTGSASWPRRRRSG